MPALAYFLEIELQVLKAAKKNMLFQFIYKFKDLMSIDSPDFTNPFMVVISMQSPEHYFLDEKAKCINDALDFDDEIRSVEALILACERQFLEASFKTEPVSCNECVSCVMRTIVTRITDMGMATAKMAEWSDATIEFAVNYHCMKEQLRESAPSLKQLALQWLQGYSGHVGIQVA